MRPSRTLIALSSAALLLVGVAAASPNLLGRHVSAGIAALAGANSNWLALSVLGFLAAFGCTVGAWRAALAAAGGPVGARDAAARLGLGSLVNSFAPAKIGDALKIALLARVIDAPGRLWTTSGVYAALAAARALALAGLLVAASATGALPLWPVFALCGAVALLAVAAAVFPRWRRDARIMRLLDGFAALERSPRAAARVLAWTAAMVTARLGATVAVTMALGLPHPLLAALVVLSALDLAGVVPLTPGSFGVGSGAVAVVLASRGIGTADALGVGIAMQAVETLVSIGVGTAGALYLARPGERVRLWAIRVGAVGAAAAGAAVVSAAVVALT